MPRKNGCFRVRAGGWFLILVVLLMSISGCALLKLPFEILGMTFKILQKVPKPPPGVF